VDLQKIEQKSDFETRRLQAMNALRYTLRRQPVGAFQPYYHSISNQQIREILPNLPALV